MAYRGSEDAYYSTDRCKRMRLDFSKQILASPHKELARSFQAKLNDYTFQALIYSCLLCGGLVTFTYFRFRNFKVHVPGMMMLSGVTVVLGLLISVNQGAKRGIQDIGRIAEDKDLDEKRTKILENCSRK